MFASPLYRPPSSVWPPRPLGPLIGADARGRAVLPVATYAPGPSSGAFFAGQTINGISFPTPSQPVEGFSAIVSGRRPGEYLAMPDNGFGTKANSFDFLLRAYYIRPDFKTAKGGTGAVDVDLGSFVQFRDPNGVIGFPIQRPDRLLTGADLDPESLQRGKNGDLWMGEEFGPWILHFDTTGVLLDPPLRVPAVLVGSTSATVFLGSPEQPVHRVGGASDRGREPGLRIGGGDARRQVPVRASRGRDGTGLEQGPPIPVGVQHPRPGLHGAGLAVPHAADGHRHAAVLLHG